MSIVSFRPIGRLGNTVFQTAACIGYAKKYGMTWAIPDRRSHSDTFEDKPTPWLLPKFWPNLPIVQYGPGNRYEQHDPSMFNYKPIPHFENGVTLVGFFQSEKWFEGAHDEVRAAFPLRHYPEYENCVSIHVRRGDYVTNANSFPPISQFYIRQAMQRFLDEFKLIKFIIFSDDIEWCKKHINLFSYSTDQETLDLITRMLEFNEDQNEYEALSKMASCSHHIIANSTFSWWGAWLGHNPNKIVVSPHHEQWYGPAWTGKPPIDLIPEKWIQVRV